MIYTLKSRSTTITSGYNHELIDEKGNVLDSGLLKKLDSLPLKEEIRRRIREYQLVNQSQLDDLCLRKKGLFRIEIKLEFEE